MGHNLGEHDRRLLIEREYSAVKFGREQIMDGAGKAIAALTGRHDLETEEDLGLRDGGREDLLGILSGDLSHDDGGW